MIYRYPDDDIFLEIKSLADEIKNDAEQLNIKAISSNESDEIKHMISSLADKIDGLVGLICN